MRLGIRKNTEIEDIEAVELNDAEAGEAEAGAAAKHGASEAGEGEKEEAIDLRKLKKKDLLEIMLRQGEEIDRLRAQVADLEAQLADYNFSIDKIGSIAEASLSVTKVFEEAEKAAKIYLMNIRSKVK